MCELGDRQQDYLWANDIEYKYRINLRYTEMLYVVICYETWTENHSRSTGNLEEKMTRYAWVSSSGDRYAMLEFVKDDD